MLPQTRVPCKWIRDSKHFILENFDLIKGSPLQIYISALTLCPSSSWLHKYSTPDVKVVVQSAEWGTCIRTISYEDFTPALTYCNNTIAVAPSDKDIILVDALTGSQTAVLSEHTKYVHSLAFSLDGTLLVSGSKDTTIKLWDVQTGGVVKTFYGHTEAVLSVSISVDNSMIASGSSDQTICLWNVKTGNHYTIGKHKDPINTVTFPPKTSQLLMSSSHGGIVQQWDIDGQQIGPPIAGSCVAFSTDGSQFVSCNKETVVIRKTSFRTAVVEFNLAKDAICCCFSPDGRFIAVGASHTIYLWDITGPDPYLVQTLIGHTDDIASLVFSSSLTLISASKDSSVKFWQIGASSAHLALPGTGPTPFTSAPIISVSLQAKDGLAFSFDSEGVVKTWDILTGDCKESYKTPAEDISCGDMQMIDDRLVVVWCEGSGQKIHVWDAERGRLKTVNAPCLQTNGLRIIGDGSRVLQIERDSIQAWSIQTGESVGREQLKRNHGYCFDPLRMDGSKVLVQSGESSAQGWDFGVPGSTPIQLSETALDRPHLDLVDAKNWLETSLVKIKDVAGKDFFQLYGRYANPSTTQWDGQYLIAGYELGEVLILDFSHVLA